MWDMLLEILTCFQKHIKIISMTQKLFFFGLIFFMSNSIVAQKTTFGLSIGIEATELREIEDIKLNEIDYHYTNSGFTKYSYLFGFDIRQDIYRSLGMSMESFVGNKNIKDVLIAAYKPELPISYTHFYNSFALEYTFKKFTIGTGIGYNTFYDIRIHGDRIGTTNVKFVPNEWIGLVNLTFFMNRFNVKVRYGFGIEDRFFLFYTKPTRSIRFTFGYDLFSTTWKKRHKKVDCPRI